MEKVTTIGLGIAKSVFQVHGGEGGWRGGRLPSSTESRPRMGIMSPKREHE